MSWTRAQCHLHHLDSQDEFKYGQTFTLKRIHRWDSTLIRFLKQHKTKGEINIGGKKMECELYFLSYISN